MTPTATRPRFRGLPIRPADEGRGLLASQEDLEPALFERFAAAHDAKYGSRPAGGFRFDPHVAHASDNADFTGSPTRFRV